MNILMEGKIVFPGLPLFIPDSLHFFVSKLLGYEISAVFLKKNITYMGMLIKGQFMRTIPECNEFGYDEHSTLHACMLSVGLDISHAKEDF